MPPRAIPKIYQLSLKTKNFAVVLIAPQTTTIAFLKARVLTALTSGFDVLERYNLNVETVNDFEICREVKERGKPNVTYEVLNDSDILKNVLIPWQPTFLRFKDSSGKLLPINPPVFSLYGDEDLPVPPDISDEEMSAKAKGKRKAPPE